MIVMPGRHGGRVRDVLLGQAQPAVTLTQALDVMRALELARESNAKHCTIPWPSSES